jgi:hypothetical protein
MVGVKSAKQVQGQSDNTYTRRRSNIKLETDNAGEEVIIVEARRSDTYSLI